MIRITDAAQKHFSKLLSNQEKGTQIRIFIINPGTSNAEYGVSYCPPDAIDPTDTKLKVNNMFIYIDKISFFYLQDIQIDFITNKLGSQLTIKILDTKTCKLNTDDPLIERLKQFLIVQINPYLASHNGQVKLINITNDMFAVIQFSGGCNGCSMANYTLKEWIEKEVLKFFPELNGVRDFTDHQHGDHSYY